MALGVMVLDMDEAGGGVECWDVPVQVPHPFMDMRIARSDISNIALEVLDIYRL